MEQIIFHMVGDYLLQNDWMAKNKKSPGRIGLIACLIHCLLYSAPFLLVFNIYQVSVIFITHFIIDRWYFVKWYMGFVGQREFAKPPTGPWSILFVDNTFHLVCNYLAITYLA